MTSLPTAVTKSAWNPRRPVLDDLEAAVRRRYTEPHRRYHDLRHLEDVLGALRWLADEAEDTEAVRLAALFHDAVYDVAAPDNEERSARLAERELSAAGVDRQRVSEVGRLIRLTATHTPEPGDRNGATLCDADLSILGAPGPRYLEYARDVRREYRDVPDDEFRAGRVRILEALLGHGIYHTATGRRLWERAALRNVAAEIDRLRGGR